jgi:hypothetical protein
LSTELSAQNKIQATGSLAVPVLRYSFGNVNLHQEELQNLDRKTRKLLTIHGQHHSKTEVDRLYVPRKQGGRDLMQLEAAHAVEIKKLHGQLPRSLDEKLVDIEQSYRWVKYGDIKGETEITIVKDQDQAISTNYFKNKTFKKVIECKCRLRKQHEGTIDRLTLGCPILAKNKYLMSHDEYCTQLQYSICKDLGTETADNL